MAIQYYAEYNSEQDLWSVFEKGQVNQWGEPYCVFPLVTWERAIAIRDGLNDNDPAYTEILLLEYNANNKSYDIEEFALNAGTQLKDIRQLVVGVLVDKVRKEQKHLIAEEILRLLEVAE